MAEKTYRSAGPIDVSYFCDGTGRHTLHFRLCTTQNVGGKITLLSVFSPQRLRLRRHGWRTPGPRRNNSAGPGRVDLPGRQRLYGTYFRSGAGQRPPTGFVGGLFDPRTATQYSSRPLGSAPAQRECPRTWGSVSRAAVTRCGTESPAPICSAHRHCVSSGALADSERVFGAHAERSYVTIYR